MIYISDRFPTTNVQLQRAKFPVHLNMSQDVDIEDKLDLDINMLPVNILLEIFKYISHENLIGSIRRTCKLWNQLSYENVLWREISVSLFPNYRLSSKSFLELLTEVSNCVEVLIIDLNALDNHVIEHESILCEKLAHICLRSERTDRQLEQYVFKLASKYPNLKTLEVCGCSLVFTDLKEGGENENGCEVEKSMFPNLNSLSFKSTIINEHTLFCYIDCHRFLREFVLIETSIDEEMLVHMITLLQELEVLNFTDSIHFVDIEKVVASLAGEQHYLKSLRALNLDLCNLDDTLLKVFVCKSAKLELISLRDTTGVTNIGLETVANSCPKLKTLFLDSDSSVFHKTASNVTDAGLERVFEKCQLLEKIGLNNCKELTDISILTLAEHCRNLREIHVVACLSLTDKSIMKLVECCPNLAYIDVSNCSQLSEKSASAILKDCKFLQQLSATTCHRVKDLQLRDERDIFVPKVQEMRSIKSVTNEQTHFEQDSPNDQLPSTDEKINQNENQATLGENQSSILDKLSYHSHVKLLDLSFCSALTNNDVKQIANFCKDLRVLELQACALVTNAAVKEIAQVCVFLKRLCISGGSISQSSRLTDACLHDIAEHASNLESFIMVKNYNITAEGMFEVVKRCPKIHEIHVEYGCLNRRSNMVKDRLITLSGEVPEKTLCIKFRDPIAKIEIYPNCDFYIRSGITKWSDD